MDDRTGDITAPRQESAEPGATRYFPPQEPYGAQGAATGPTPGAAPQGNGNVRQETPAAAQRQWYPVPAARHDRDRTMLALILIGGGLLFLLGQFDVFDDFGDLVPLLLGGIFLYAYLNTQHGYRIGFLIPGAILLGIGVGVLLENITFLPLWVGGDVTAFTLGLGFCLIWVFERKHWWALIPGGILVLSSLASVAMVGALWPVALILLGVYLLYDQSRRRHI